MYDVGAAVVSPLLFKASPHAALDAASPKAEGDSGDPVSSTG